MSSKRHSLPYDDVVGEIRSLQVNRSYSSGISDDVDMYWVGLTGSSPMERVDADNARSMSRCDRLAAELVAAGAPAAEAVAKGLRMQGRWREKLLPFARRFQALASVHAALLLVAKRERDPMARPAREILGLKVPRRRAVR